MKRKTYSPITKAKAQKFEAMVQDLKNKLAQGVIPLTK